MQHLMQFIPGMMGCAAAAVPVPVPAVPVKPKGPEAQETRPLLPAAGLTCNMQPRKVQQCQQEQEKPKALEACSAVLKLERKPAPPVNCKTAHLRPQFQKRPFSAGTLLFLLVFGKPSGLPNTYFA